MKLTKQVVESAIDVPGGYDTSLDERLFSDEFRTPILKRGCMTRAEVIEIGRWKARRATGYMKTADADVPLITAAAFAQEDARLASWILRCMSGVGTPMASAILTVFDPERYTVVDVRAIATLRALDYVDLDLERPAWVNDSDVTRKSELYGRYVELCRSVAHRVDVPLRTLDRALYALNGRDGIG